MSNTTLVYVNPKFTDQEDFRDLFNLHFNNDFINSVLDKDDRYWLDSNIKSNEEVDLQSVLGKNELEKIMNDKTHNYSVAKHMDMWRLSLKKNDSFESFRKKLKENFFNGFQVKYKGCFYYNGDGYMGWHTNCESPGRRLYMTWNSSDKSYFMWHDGEMINNFKEPAGWSFKLFDINKCSENKTWHSVYAGSERISIGMQIS